MDVLLDKTCHEMRVSR